MVPPQAMKGADEIGRRKTSLSWHISVTVSRLNAIRLEVKTHGLTNVVRVSVHYYESIPLI